MSELGHILFAVWLDTRTKSTVDDFEAKTTEKTREHVRVSVYSRRVSIGCAMLLLYFQHNLWDNVKLMHP